MEFNEVLRMRQSVRRYTEEKVSAEDIQAILTAAQHAPVGMHNSKGYVLTVISSETVLALMKKIIRKRPGKTMIRCMVRLCFCWYPKHRKPLKRSRNMTRPA